MVDLAVSSMIVGVLNVCWVRKRGCVRGECFGQLFLSGSQRGGVKFFQR